MAEAKARKKSGLISHGIAAQNRKARFDYTIKETVEAGLVLKGPEVKSLRHGRASLTEAWAGERAGEEEELPTWRNTVRARNFRWNLFPF